MLLMARYKLAVNLGSSRTTQDSVALVYMNLTPATQRIEMIRGKAAT